MKKPVVGIAMGSRSDWDVMRHAAQQLDDFGVPFEARIVSAHRTPDLLYEYAQAASSRGLRCIIAGAGGLLICPACSLQRRRCRCLAYRFRRAT